MTEFRVPMKRVVVATYILLLAASTAAATWCFRSGLTWSAICILAVALPLGLLYWFMLLVNPARTRLTLTEEGLLIEGPPFINAAIPYAEMVGVFEAGLDDKQFKPGKCDRGMRFVGYLNGIFDLPGDITGLVLANKTRVVGVQTADQLYLLGPDRPDELFEGLRSRT